MLTDQELQSAVQSLVDDWHRTYPTPWPLMFWLYEIHSSGGGGVSLWGKFIRSILPSQEWWDWFFQTAMYAGSIKWGQKACLEYLEITHSENARDARTLETKWRTDRDDWAIELMRKCWFPQWEPPQKVKLQFPSKGIAPLPAAPPKDMFTR